VCPPVCGNINPNIPLPSLHRLSEHYAKLLVHVLSCLAAFEREKYKEEEPVEGSKMDVDGEEVSSIFLLANLNLLMCLRIPLMNPKHDLLPMWFASCKAIWPWYTHYCPFCRVLSYT